MLNLNGLWDTQFMAMLLVVSGYALRKAGVLDLNLNQGISNLVLKFLLPCSILRAFRQVPREQTNNFGTLLLLAAIIQVSIILISRICFRKTEKTQRAFKSFAIQYSNCGFLGIPVCQSVFGDQGVIYAAIIQIPILIAMWTVGISLFENDNRAVEWRQMLLKLVKIPVLEATLLGIIVMITGITYPDILVSTLDSASACITPLVMLVIGSMLPDGNMHKLMCHDVIGLSLARLIAIPALVMAMCSLVKMNSIMSETFLLMFAMPVPTIGAVLSVEYGQDTEFAINAVVFSTLLSMLTVPLLCTIYLS